MPSTRLASLIATLFLIPLHAHGAPQEVPAERGAEQRLERQLAYLERRPFHPGAFARAVHEAVECGRLDEVEADFARRLAEDPLDRPARVLLARLAARARRGQEALALLEPLEDEDPPLLRMRGELWLQTGDTESAIGAFERAVKLSERRLDKEELLTLVGRAHLRADRPAEAEKAFRAIAELDPMNFELRIEAAARLAEAQLTQGAIDELGVAVELAEGDATRTVRAEVERGRLAERAGETALALACFDRAAQLTGPGHWQRAELFARRVELHRALRTLDDLVRACAKKVEASPGDTDARRFLARALQATGEFDGARAVLELAADDFPASLELSVELVDLLESRGFSESAIGVLQRIASEHPSEVRLQRRLGLLLAAVGQDQAAHRVWSRAVEQAPDDIALRLEVGRLHARFGMEAEAEHLLRDALEAAPGNMRVANTLASFLEDTRRGSQVEPLLRELEARARRRGDAHFLEELASEWVARERPTLSVRALEAALDAGGERRRLSHSLAVLLENGRRPVQADGPLRELFALETGASERAQLVERIYQVHASSGRANSLLRREQKVLDREPRALLPALIVSRAHEAEGRAEEAAAPLTARLRHDPDDIDAIEHLTRLATRSNHGEEAVRLLRRSIELRPGEGRALLERIARQHRLAGNEQALTAVYEEMLANEPESRSLLAELARVHRSESAPRRAVRFLERAVSLDPHDGETRLELAALHMRLGELEAAHEQLLHALVSDEEEVRARARKASLALQSRLTTPDWEIESARIELAAKPEQPGRAIWLAMLHRGRLELEAADAVLRSTLERFPLDPALIEAREALRGLAHGATETAFDARRAAGSRATGERVQEVVLGALLISQGRTARAHAVLSALEDPALEAAVFSSLGEPREARRVLERALDRQPDSVELALRAVLACEESDSARELTRALERARGLAPDSFAIELRLGAANAQRHRTRAVREVGERLFALLDQSRPHLAHGAPGVALHERRVSGIEALFLSSDLQRDFLDMAEVALREKPTDAVLLAAWMRSLGPRHDRRARKLLAHIRAGGGLPAHMNSVAWDKALKSYEAEVEVRRGGRSSGRGH